MRGDQNVKHMMIATEYLAARLGQFHAHHDGHNEADNPRDNGEDQIHRADVLVVGRIDKTAPTSRVVMVAVAVGGICVAHNFPAGSLSRPFFSVWRFCASHPALHREARPSAVQPPTHRILIWKRPPPDRHETVLNSTKLGALPIIDALPGCLEPCLIEAAGHRIDLDAKRGYSPRMQHIGSGHLDPDLSC